jgi:hypothetical protein
MRKLIFVHDYVFPDFCLPNALNPQLAIINYIISQYNNKFTYSTFLEQNTNLFETMFDNSIGQTQNTLSGFIVEATVYGNKINYEYDSLYNTIQKHKKFIYPIKPNPVFENFAGGINNGLNISKNHGDYFWKFISKRALTEIKKGNGIILIDYSMEPFITYEQHKMLHESLKSSALSNDSIYITVNSFNAKELYERWFNVNERMYNVVNTPFCLEHSSYYYDYLLKRGDNKVMSISKFLESKNTFRRNHFLMKIKAPKEHRLKTLIYLIDNDIINFGDWSFSGDCNFTNTNEFKWAIRNIHLKNLNNVCEVLNNGPYNLQSENSLSFNTINAWTDETYEPHINSYFDICFESFFYNESTTLSITEKIFKSIINFQPFIFVTTTGTLKLLKKLGFKTFDGFIDESYDNVIDNDERIKLIHSEIKKLCSLSKEEIHNWYWSMEDILIHNHNHLLNIHRDKMITEKFFDSLYDKLA